MYKTSSKYKENIYKPYVQSVVNIYVDGVLLNPKYLLDFKSGCQLFDENLELGSVPSQYIELKIHRNSGITNPKMIKIEYGIYVNNTITVVEEVNKMLTSDLNRLNVRSLSKNNNKFEIIPIGIYNVDDYKDEDGNTIQIKALDNVIKLDTDDGYYDAKELINQKGYATLGEIAQDICNKKGLELETSSFLNSDKRINVYDNQIKAREYMSYISECAGSFCCATRLGKIAFRNIGQDKIEVPLKLFKTYKFGEEYQISKVAYEDGVRSFKFGDETRNTLWIRQDNLFIADEDIVKNIYNLTKELTMNSFEGSVIIDPALDIGDKIIIDGKTVIYQGEMALNGRFIANIKSKISISQKQETTVKKENQSIINRRVQSSIDQVNGKIEHLVEEVDGETGKFTRIEQTANSAKTIAESKVGRDEFATELEVNSEAVKTSWNKITEFLQMMILNNNASLAVLDKDKNVMMSLDKLGQHFFKNGTTNPFGEMGVQKINDTNYISFAVSTDYGNSINDGMAWGVKTKDGKFWPILSVTNFTMPPQNSGGCTGEMLLSGCDLVLDAENGGIVSNGVKMQGDAMPGIFFYDIESQNLLLSITPSNSIFSARIGMLDNISFYKNQDGSNSFKIGNGERYCLFTDDGAIDCYNLTSKESIYCHGYVISEQNIHTMADVTANGNISANGNVYGQQFISDRREKKNIRNSNTNAIEKLKKIKHRQFEWKRDNKHTNIGYVAQELETIDKEFVMKKNVIKDGKKTDEKYYVNLLPILATSTKAIQEQQEQIEELKKRNEQKDKVIQDLISRVESLERSK